MKTINDGGPRRPDVGWRLFVVGMCDRRLTAYIYVSYLPHQGIYMHLVANRGCSSGNVNKILALSHLGQIDR